MTTDNINIKNVGGELLVDSRDLAKGLGIEHEDFLQLIENNRTQLEQFGEIRYHQEESSDDDLHPLAEKFGLDLDVLNKDIARGKLAEQILAHQTIISFHQERVSNLQKELDSI